MLAVLVGILLTLVYNRRPVETPGCDQAIYMAVGQSMAGGAHIDDRATFPPLYPFASSLFLRLGLNTLLSFHLTCLVSFILLILLLARISNELGLGSIPVLVIVTCPSVFAYGWTEMSEMLFTLLATAAIWTFLHLNSTPQALVSAVLIVLSYETRYVGEFLLLALGVVTMIEYLRGQPIRHKLLALLIGVTGLISSMALNYWRYGRTAGDRPSSQLNMPMIFHDLGLGLWMTWFGDGPVSKLTFISWPLALVSLAALCYLLFDSLKGAPPIRTLAITVISYLLLLVAAEDTVFLDAIRRRLLMPIIPMIILLCFHRLQIYKRGLAPLLVASISIAVVHMIKGRVM